MGDRRSGRARKQVDYGKFGADSDNDDDFADPTPPPAKKQKKSEKNDKGKVSKTSKTPTSERSTSRKGRMPLEEKLYERDLQAALEMSLQASHEQQGVSGQSNGTMSESSVILHSTPLSASQIASNKPEMPVESQNIMPSAIPHSVAANDDIEFLGTVTCSDSESPLSKRRSTSRKRKTYTFDDDSDDESADSEDFSDEAESSDSDFSNGDSDFHDGKTKGKSKAKGKVKAAPVKKNPTVTSGKSQSMPAGKKKAATVQQNHEVPSQSTSKVHSKVSSVPGNMRTNPSTSNPSSSRVSSTTCKPPAWTPPGRNDGCSSVNTSMKSSPSGLRLGLSRHARIKPLHPSLKVS